MASERRADLKEKVNAVVADLDQDGLNGCLEHAELGKLILDLHKFHDEKHLEQLMGALSRAVEEVIVTEEAEGATLMVLAQLLKDVGAAVQEGASLELLPRLQLGLISALTGYAKPGTSEAGDIFTCAGLLCMEGGVLDKVAGDAVLSLAVEKALLHLLVRSKKVVLLLRERKTAFNLAMLNLEIEARKDYSPNAEDEESGDGDSADEDFEGEEDEGSEDEGAGEDEGAEDDE